MRNKRMGQLAGRVARHHRGGGDWNHRDVDRGVLGLLREPDLRDVEV